MCVLCHNKSIEIRWWERARTTRTRTWTEKENKCKPHQNEESTRDSSSVKRQGDTRLCTRHSHENVLPSFWTVYIFVCIVNTKGVTERPFCSTHLSRWELCIMLTAISYKHGALRDWLFLWLSNQQWSYCGCYNRHPYRTKKMLPRNEDSNQIRRDGIKEKESHKRLQDEDSSVGCQKRMK